ncbi:phosphate ABC transporter permease subunit PstC [Martelella alba]|uniref:Phosphate transport system permease protein n=1 Tax=Martelella alba TaxID=2590451 RepID=A0A506U299_9HYPH|nr:phosphate ABC transporter permease subunit PstC [Martelella alba]TPW27506.1 phosphate ABC transporter permease subunit PstC [Martelella alba]
MFLTLTLALLAAFGFAGFLAARARAFAFSDERRRPHSRPTYHGAFVAVATVLPALIIVLVWLAISPAIVGAYVRSGFPETLLAQPLAMQDLAYDTVAQIATGLARLPAGSVAAIGAGDISVADAFAGIGIPVADNPSPALIDAAVRLDHAWRVSGLCLVGLVTLVALGGMVLSYRRVRPAFRARSRIEQLILAGLVLASSLAVLTTLGIVLSMLIEALRFFSIVSPRAFFFGTVWDPRFGLAGENQPPGQFGLVPLLAGTLYIALVALLVAVPIGLYAAIYMAEYAGSRLRLVAKPALEVLAGIPTIVYGFFALVTVGPFFRDLSASLNRLFTGEYTAFIQAQSVLTAGVVMGLMLIPYVSSLADDIINAVPEDLREGSLGLGATRSETIKRVVLPAALPGIVGALLLTASRAIGETMIVVLAAGVAAQLHLDPFEPMTTITVKIVSQLTGDLEFTSPQTLVAFALGLTLFVLTLGLNIYALYIVRRYREQYE